MSEEDSNSNIKDEKNIIVIDNAESNNIRPAMPGIIPNVFLQDNKWTEPATQLLLDLYIQKEERFRDPHTKKKQVWGEISEILKTKGYNFDADKCERKFLNLKTVYRNTVHHNCMTGNFERKCSFYNELEKIFQLTEKVLGEKMTGKSNTGLPDGVTPGSHSRDIPLQHRNSNGDTRQSVVPVRLFTHAQETPQSSPDSRTMTTASNSTFSNMQPNVISPRLHVNGSNASPTLPRPNPANLRTNQNRALTAMQMAYSEAQNRERLASQNVSQQRNVSAQHSRQNSTNRFPDPPAGTAIIDLCQELPNTQNKRTINNEDQRIDSVAKKRKSNDLQSLLESFETYRREQREREEQRTKLMKEMHEDEMRVTNRFLDIIQQCVQGGTNE